MLISSKVYLTLLVKVDCKTVGFFFFTKSVKKSVKRGVRVLRARVLEYAKIPTVLQSNLKGLWHASAQVRHLDFCSGERFFKIGFW